MAEKRYNTLLQIKGSPSPKVRVRLKDKVGYLTKEEAEKAVKEYGAVIEGYY